MGAMKQRLIIDFEVDNDGEVDITYQLDPKAEEVPQEGQEHELLLMAMTACDMVYKGMKEIFK